MIKRVYQFLEGEPVIGIIMGVVVIVIVWFMLALRPLGQNEIIREVVIREGMGLTAVSDYLYEDGLIRSPLAFRWYGLFAGGAHKVKPGVYRFQKGMSGVSILERLITGPDVVNVTITPGMTIKDIDTIFSEKRIIAPHTLERIPIEKLSMQYPFLKGAKSLEGFLWPETYEFTLAADPMMVINKILNEFNDHAVPFIREKLYRTVTIASLIEKEIPDHDDDRAIVSGIIDRRLQLGMGLQIDATVVYAVCGGAVRNCAKRSQLTRADFQIDSSYNTYRYAGLPPTPIGSPGISAITAALHPKKTQYLYYLSEPKAGKTIFSETLEEHNDNRARYLGL